MKPAPSALDLVRAGLERLPGERLRDDRRILRLDGDGLEGGLARLDALRVTPVIVPPVPTAETRMSILPSVSSQNSSAVVFLWISGLAGLLNCCGIHEFGVFLREFLGAGDRAFHAFGAGREHQLRAEHREQRAALERHRLGHGEDELVALGRGDEGQRDAGVAAGRLDDHGVLVDHAALLGVFDHGHADAVLHAAERIEEFELEREVVLGSTPRLAGILFSFTRGVRPTVSTMLL